MFLQLICTAKKLRSHQLALLKEKETAFSASEGKDTKLTIQQKYRRQWVDVIRRCKRCSIFPRHSCPYQLSFNIRHEGTCENFTAKSIAGFLGGFFLTYIFFMFFVLQLNFKLSTATIMCSIFGSILTIGLAFSYKVRCIVFLVLPQFFSKKGRQALLAYAYILAITGPATNTLNNMSILGESMACGQEQLKEAVRQILEVIKKPFYAIRDAIKSVVKVVKQIVVKIKEILLTIKRIIMSLIKIIKEAFEFLAKIMNICNKELGTPFERCSMVFENAITDCNAKLGPFFNWLCNITYLVKSVCYIVKPLDILCVIIDFIKDTVGAIVKKVKQFIRHVRTMFYVRIKFSHSYHFESNHSKSMADITTGIVTEIKQRSAGMIKIFDFMSSAASLFFTFMVVKVIYYRHKFLTNERFDNKFISKYFRKIDMRRAQLGLDTVLPLNHRERQQYVTMSSLRLVKKEKSQLSKSAMALLMATLKLATHMATDYSLFWIMTLIRYYGRFQSKLETPSKPLMHIEGEGFLASLLRGIVKAFQPIGLNLEIDTIPCLPDPIPPDYDRYIQIGSLLVLCWFLAIFEPYGLRFRHSVMCYYYPLRAKERAIWLYNNILRSRSSFLKFARRQLRRKVKGDKKITKVTLAEYLRANLKCKVCIWILGNKKQEACLLCGEVFRESDSKKPIRCQTPNCPGIYCDQCFQDLQNICTVCMDPIQYGDMSDISEEKDSSEADIVKTKIQKKKKFTKKKSKKEIKKDKHDSDDSDGMHEGDTTQLLFSKCEKDSDYCSSNHETETDVSTDYSYTYQNNKDITMVSEMPTKYKFKDIEKQNIPQYTSIQELGRDLKDKPGKYSDGSESTSSVITELYEAESLANPRVTSQYFVNVYTNPDIQARPSSSKISLASNRYTDSLNSTRMYSSSSLISEFEPPITSTSPNKLQDVFIKKTNSKISTSSVSMECNSYSSTDMSGGNLVSHPSTPTTLLISPPIKESKIIKTIYPPKSSRTTSYDVSPVSMVAETSFITELDNLSDSIHPDVPKLDLDFLDKDIKPCSCPSTIESPTATKSCNCRFFKDSVRFSTITETIGSRTTQPNPRKPITNRNHSRKDNISVSSSSLISSICKDNHDKYANTRSIMVNYNRSPDRTDDVSLSHSPYSIFTVKSTDKTDDISMMESVAPTSSRFYPYPDLNIGGSNIRKRKSSTVKSQSNNDELYRQRIRDYYHHMKSEPVTYYKTKQKKSNIISRILAVFHRRKSALL